jgi:thiosulfate/3-mercaptopyruvate sulfurtransferase
MMRKLNIFEDNRVVIYNSISAAKVWFIMKYYGHPNTFLLDGGMREWAKRKYPVNSFKSPIDYSTHSAKTFEAKTPDENMLIDMDEVINKIGKPQNHIVIKI